MLIEITQFQNAFCLYWCLLFQFYVFVVLNIYLHELYTLVIKVQSNMSDFFDIY